MTPRQLALRVAARLGVIERKALKRMRPILAEIERRAINNPGMFFVGSNELRKLIDLLAESLVAAHGLAKLTPIKAAEDDLVDKRFLDKVTPDQLESIRSIYNQEATKVFSQLSTSLSEGVRNAVNDAATSGIPISSAVKHYFESSGMDPKKFSRFTTLVRTQLQLNYSATRWNEYQSPDIKEIIWGFRYVTVGDDRVREEHLVLDGVTLPKDDPFWNRFFPPNGWNCRCQAIPIFSEEEIKRPPADATPDIGFDFNAGEVASRLANADVPIVPPKPIVVPTKVKRTRKPKATPAGGTATATATKPAKTKVKVEVDVRPAKLEDAIKQHPDVVALQEVVALQTEAKQTLKEYHEWFGRIIEEHGPAFQWPPELKPKLEAQQKAWLDKVQAATKRKTEAEKVLAETKARANKHVRAEMEKQARLADNNRAEVSVKTFTNDRVVTKFDIESAKYNQEDAERWINTYGNRNQFEKSAVPVDLIRGRSHAGVNSISMDVEAPATTYIHEWGHHYEYNLSQVGYEEVRSFIDARVRNNPLEEIYFGSGENGYKDDFEKAHAAVYGAGNRAATKGHYTGKVYPEAPRFNKGGTPGALRRPSEVISMGMELMYADPASFYAADPEWFNLIDGVLSGRIK